MKSCSPLSQSCIFSHLTHHPMLCVCVWFQIQSTLLPCFLASLWCWQSRLHIHLTHYCGALCIPQPSNPSPNGVCVCGSNNNQHCSTAFLASLWCWQSRLHIHLTPYCGALRIPQPSNPSPNVVCVCGSSYNQHCSAAFWQAFGADKAGSTSIFAHLRTFEHFCAFILLSFSIFLSYFLLSQSFFLTFSFLNLSLLLSPFSIFLSYFLLFLSFSVYLPKTVSLTI